eukprot:jgi/Botrbrau1/17552/Bobra.0166s0001.2
MEPETDLRIPALQEAYRGRSLTPLALLQALYPKYKDDPAVFITLAPWEHLEARCLELQSLFEGGQQPPLYGVPFAVKDNIDACPYPTTAACKAFEYTPGESAPCVQALLDAGGIMVGKTNMDQFASGLVGTRTPYGTARNAFDDRFIPGGSSSGSAPLVANNLVSFALGTDTAGSGRIPAGYNGCVGAKSTVGRVTTKGVVPACRSLDVVSCFAATVPDAALVVQIMESAGTPADPQWRAPPPGLSRSLVRPPQFRYALPNAEFLDFSGPGGPGAVEVYKQLFLEAVERLNALGGELVKIDFYPFATTARLLYESALIAERVSGIKVFLESGEVKPCTAASVREDARLEKVIGAILARGLEYEASDVFDALTRLNELRCEGRLQLEKVDIIMVPTALHHYLVEEVEATEKRASPPTYPYNANLGRFTNFVNLMDLCALSVPSGVATLPIISPAAPGEESRRAKILEKGRPAPQLPFGVTFIAPSWRDELLWAIGEAFHEAGA